MISKEMKFGTVKQEIIYRAGILHDLGKLGIVDAILNKPGSLNDDEWSIMKKHPIRAVEILSPLTFLFEEKEIILHHHERYNGKGYPGGFKGEKIPLGSRIMAVADTFDAMNSARAYRKKMSREVIIAELKICMFYYNSYDIEVMLCEDLQKIKKLDNLYSDIII